MTKKRNLIVDNQLEILNSNKMKQNNLESSQDEKTEILKIQKEALQREQERTRGIIEEAHIGFLVVDGYSEEVFLLNSLGKKHLNIREESKNNYFFKNYKEIFSNPIIDILSKIMLKIQNEKKVIDFGEFTIGKELMLSIVSYPIMMDEAVSSIVIATTDVTEKQILEQQILQASRLADIGELAAVVAHEINNPVAFVDSNTHALKKYVTKISTFMTKVNEIENFLENFHIDEDNILDVYQDVLSLNNVIQDKKEELKKLKESLKIDKTIKNMEDIIFENLDGLDRIKKIVADLKTFSYMGDEKPENSNINTILDESIKLIWNTIKYKLKIVRKYESLPECICLPRQLSQVFSNIIINASHAVSSDGEIAIETFIENHSINIRISDNGCGMTEKTIKKIFDPFYTTKKLHSGTGLGLSISLKIIDKHKGTIRVKSELNKGTSFLISLPLNKGNKENKNI